MNPSPTHRDLRVDLARGFALLCIFIDHNAYLDRFRYGWMTSVTLARFSFLDAADVFFFLSGYVSGQVCTNAVRSMGLGRASQRAFTRCFQLYTAQVIMLALCLALIRGTGFHNTSTPWEALERFQTSPQGTIIGALAFIHPSPFFGLLPLYMLFVGLSPAAIFLRIHRPAVLIWMAIGTYLLAAAVPGLRAFNAFDGFNPLSWQLVFALGLMLGYEQCAGDESLQWAQSRTIVRGAISGLALIALFRLAPSGMVARIIHSDVLRQIVPQSFAMAEKRNAGPLRLLNLSLWVIVGAAMNPVSRVFKHRAARIITMCGQNSLVVFCASVLINYIVLIYSSRMPSGLAATLCWTLWGGVAMVLTAYVWNWLRAAFRGHDSVRVNHFIRAYGHVGGLLILCLHNFRELFAEFVDR